MSPHPLQCLSRSLTAWPDGREQKARGLGGLSRYWEAGQIGRLIILTNYPYSWFQAYNIPLADN